MRIRIPKTLVTFPSGEKVIAYNYLTKDGITCAYDDLYWLSLTGEWVDISKIIEDHPDTEPESIRDAYAAFLNCGMLIEEGSAAHKLEQQYEKDWEFGSAAGIFHFSLLDNKIGTLADSAALQRQKMQNDPSPPLFWRNDAGAIPLPRPNGNSSIAQLMEVMQNRRSIRTVHNQPITASELGACLYAGLGIVGFVKTEVTVLPLKMTPSGGARNPYEAFVVVKNVVDLEPGLYHYSAIDHTLAKCDAPTDIDVGELLMGQEWANDMAAVIFLVAVLERTMWKYNDPNSYRVVLIEAGHIAQNMMLACTANKLTACPTGAIAHTFISKALSLDHITHTPVYALSIGHPTENQDKILSVQEFKALSLAGPQ
jgi:SagB-type dehydrogenase family enzyme